jgi:hypothetical protein
MTSAMLTPPGFCQAALTSRSSSSARRGSLRTTEKYLHTLPDADETALEALSKMPTRATAV